MKTKLQIFISSTYIDLREERQAAVMAILKAGHIPAGMELFAAGDESQMETIKRWITESDVYMLILGGRYGSIEPKTSLSYIELEYDYAISIGIPVFSVVINEKELDRRIKKRGKEVTETVQPRELKLFREKVLSKTSSFFDDPKDIKLAIHETISDFIARHEFKGWISGSEIPDTQPLFEEIKRLSKENKELQEEIKSLSEKATELAKTSEKGETKEELIKILSGIIIEHKFPSQEKSIKRNLLDLFIIAKDTLVVGITNSIGMSDYDQFMYFNVCPKLQIHGLVINEKVSGVRYRRFSLTKKGMELLAYIDKLNMKVKK